MEPNDPRYFPRLAIFQDWYLINEKTDEAWGLLECTFHQALQWAVAHLDLSLDWHCLDPKEKQND
jgi:hypothetical protein